MGSAGHIAFMGDVRITQRMLLEDLRGLNHSRDVRVKN
jgi:hypothetical protein